MQNSREWRWPNQKRRDRNGKWPERVKEKLWSRGTKIFWGEISFCHFLLCATGKKKPQDLTGEYFGRLDKDDPKVREKKTWSCTHQWSLFDSCHPKLFLQGWSQPCPEPLPCVFTVSFIQHQNPQDQSIVETLSTPGRDFSSPVFDHQDSKSLLFPAGMTYILLSLPNSWRVGWLSVIFHSPTKAS